MSAESIRPLQDHVLVKRVAETSDKKVTILLPDIATPMEMRGDVLAVGPGKRCKNGSTRPPGVRVEDRIYFQPDAGVEIRFEGETLLMLRETEIFAVERRKAHSREFGRDSHTRAVLYSADHPTDEDIFVDDDDDIFDIKYCDPNLVAYPGRAPAMVGGD